MEDIFGRKPALEWVVLCGNKEFYLTEAQFTFLMEAQEKRFVAFRDIVIQPSFIAWAFSRPASVVLEKYPCKTCNSNGMLIGEKRDENGKFPVCTVCSGTGIDSN